MLKYIIATVAVCIIITILYNRRLKLDYEAKYKKLQDDYLKAQDKLKNDIDALECEKDNFETYRQSELYSIQAQWEKIDREKQLNADICRFKQNMEEIESQLNNREKQLQEREKNLNNEIARFNSEYQHYINECEKAKRYADDRFDHLVSMYGEVEENRIGLKNEYREFYDIREKFAKTVMLKSLLHRHFKKTEMYKRIVSENYLGLNRFYHFINDETHGVHHEICEISIEAKIKGTRAEPYKTTLYECDCDDFQKNLHGQEPCKHMYMLAYELALLNELPLKKMITALKPGSEVFVKSKRRK